MGELRLANRLDSGIHDRRHLPIRDGAERVELASGFGIETTESNETAGRFRAQERRHVRVDQDGGEGRGRTRGRLRRQRSDRCDVDVGPPALGRS